MSQVSTRRPSFLRPAAVALVALTLGLPSSAAPAVTVGVFTVYAPVRFEDMLPEDCLIFGSIDLGAARKGEGPLALARIFEEPEVAAFVGSVSERVRGVQTLVNRVCGDPKTGASIAQVRRIGFSFGGVHGQPGPKGSAEPTVAVAIEIGGDPSQFLGALTHLRDLARDGAGLGRGLDVSEKRHFYMGQEITEVSVGSGPADLQVAYTLLDSMLVAAPDPLSVQSLVDNYRRPLQAPLSRLDTFLRTRERAGGDSPRLLVFFNAQAFRDRYLGQLSAEEKSVWAALGLEDVDGVAYSLGFDGPACVERLYVLAPEPRKSWIETYDGSSAGDFASLDFVSREAAYYSAWRSDWAKEVANLERMARVLEPEASGFIAAAESEFERRAGLRLRDDFLASLGDEISVSALLLPGSFVPYGLVSVELEDAETFDRALRGLLGSFGVKLVPSGTPGAAGSRIENLTWDESSGLPSYEAFAAFSGFVMPCVMREKNSILFASHPIVLTSILAGQGKGVSDPMRSHPEIGRALARTGPKPNALEFVDLGKVFTILYNAVTPLLLGVPSKNLPFDAALLPTAESIVRHLFPLTTTSGGDRDGYLWQSRSPVPVAAAAIAAAAGAVAWHTAKVEPGAAAERDGEAGTEGSVASVADLERQALRLQAAGRFAEAIATLDRAIEMDSKAGMPRFNRGYLKIALGHQTNDVKLFASAREDFVECVRLGCNVADSQYNVACTLALQGEKDAAFDALRKAIQLGFNKSRLLREDHDLDSLRSDARFADIVREFESGSRRDR